MIGALQHEFEFADIKVKKLLSEVKDFCSDIRTSRDLSNSNYPIFMDFCGINVGGRLFQF